MNPSSAVSAFCCGLCVCVYEMVASFACLFVADYIITCVCGLFVYLVWNNTRIAYNQKNLAIFRKES